MGLQLALFTSLFSSMGLIHILLKISNNYVNLFYDYNHRQKLKFKHKSVSKIFNLQLTSYVIKLIQIYFRPQKIDNLTNDFKKLFEKFNNLSHEYSPRRVDSFITSYKVVIAMMAKNLKLVTVHIQPAPRREGDQGHPK